MLTGTIANGVIKVVLEGVAAAQRQLASVQAAFDRTAKSAKQISNTATAAFASASAAALGFARVADPLGSLQLDIAFARVSVQLGRFFIPLLSQAADALNRLANYLGSLSDETRESVLHWTKLFLGITGVVSVAGKLVGVFGGVASALGSVWSVASGVASVLWRILGFLGPWGRLIVVVGTLAAAFLGLSKAGESTEGVMGRIVSAGRRTWEALKTLWGKLVEVVGPAISKAGGVIEAAWDKIVGTVTQVWDKLATRLGPSLVKLAGVVGSLLSTVGPVVKAFVERLGRDFERFGQLVGVVFDKLAPAIEGAFGGELVGTVERVVNGITRAIESVRPYAERLSQWLVAAFESDTGGDFGKAFEGFGQSVGTAIAAAVALADKIGGAFASVAQRLQPISEAVAEVWDKATGPTTSFLKVLEELGTTGESIGAKIGAGFDRVKPYLERIGAVAGRVFDDIKAAAAPVVAALVDAFDAVAPAVSRLFDKLVELGAALVRLGGAVREFFGEKLAEALKAIRPVAEAVIGGITEKLEKFFKFVADGFEAIYPTVKAVIDAIGKGFVSVVNYVKNAFYDMVEAVLGLVGGVVDKINKLIDGINRVKPGDNIPNIENPKDGLKRPDNIKTPDALPDLPKPAQKPVAQPAPQPPAPPQPAPPKPVVPLPGVAEVAPAPREKKEDKGQGSNRFVGQLLGGARFVGIAEAMRAAQQATVPTRETAILEEISRGQRDANANLEKIAENTGKGTVIGLK